MLSRFAQFYFSPKYTHIYIYLSQPSLSVKKRLAVRYTMSKMTKPLQGLKSQELHHTDQSPQHENSAITRDTSSTKSKKVSFSRYSTKRIYATDPHYENWKSYSSADQKTFRKEAIHDAFLIKLLVSTFSLPTATAIHELMKQGSLTREQLLGIEHLFSMDAEQSSHKRLSNINFVLSVQQQMREQNENKVNADMLALIAIAKSSRMSEKARLRAALAL